MHVALLLHRNLTANVSCTRGQRSQDPKPMINLKKTHRQIKRRCKGIMPNNENEHSVTASETNHIGGGGGGMVETNHSMTDASKEGRLDFLGG